MPSVVITYLFHEGTPHEFRVNCKPSDAYTETVFADGTRVPARPQDTEEYRERARQLGYGDDVASMSREHELMHSLLAEKRELPYSLVLWALAHGGEAAEAAQEEAEVLRLQGLLNLPAHTSPDIGEDWWIWNCRRLLQGNPLLWRNPFGRE